MKFADNLKRIRKSKNISQEALAEKVGVSRQSVSKWETSEAYPEMNNILELCKIFHCHIGDLINDQMIDLDSLDEEVKMSVVKFKKEKQKQMKGISKVLSLIGKISSIVLWVGFAFLLIGMIFIPIGFSAVDVKDGELIVNNQVLEMVEKGNTVEVRIGEKVLVGTTTDDEIHSVIPAIEKYSKTGVVVFLELGLAIIGAFMICMIKLLKHLEKMFLSIHEGDTPFTLENVDHIKKMTYLLIACILLAGIGEILLNIPLRNQVNIEFSLLTVLEIIFLYSMSLIFEYGYEIQLDSKGKMYDEENA